MDNVFIERVWRSMKYEDVYLKGHTDGGEAKAGVGDWIIFLQRAPSSGARLSRADGRLAQTGAAQGMWICGQRKLVNHMPAGGSETAADRKDNQQTGFQFSRRQNRSR
jgi:hypothetical protein